MPLKTDDLDSLLRQASPPIEDDGFSERVLAALPARSVNPGRAPVLGGAGLASLAVLLWGPAREVMASLMAPSNMLEWYGLMPLLVTTAVVIGTALSVAVRESAEA